MIQCRIAKSLGGGFEGTPNDVWGTVDYTDKYEPCVFFGLYDVRDYLALWLHRGKRWVLWAGGDLKNLDSGFALNDGKLKWMSKIPIKWWLIPLLKRCENWVENYWEARVLAKFGIQSHICPSFLGNIDDFPVSYQYSDRPNVYISCSGGKESEYGIDQIQRIASKVSECDFHIYGSDFGDFSQSNVLPHGKVPIKQMNEEISHMQCGLRLNKTDGFSEISAKSILMGQYPITYLDYPRIDRFKTDEELIKLLKELRNKRLPNGVSNYYRLILNQYPWIS